MITQYVYVHCDSSPIMKDFFFFFFVLFFLSCSFVFSQSCPTVSKVKTKPHSSNPWDAGGANGLMPLNTTTEDTELQSTKGDRQRRKTQRRRKR